jgi:hypothetical protein
MDKHYNYNLQYCNINYYRKKFYNKDPQFVIHDSILKTTIEIFQLYFILHQRPML